MVTEGTTIADEAAKAFEECKKQGEPGPKGKGKGKGDGGTKRKHTKKELSQKKRDKAKSGEQPAPGGAEM